MQLSLFKLPKEILLRDLEIVESHCRKEVNDFLLQHHYLGGVIGWKRAYLCIHVPTCNKVGVAVWGRPRARYEDQKQTLELYRFCLLDECPRNSESYILAKMMRILAPQYRLISYSDIEEGHTGTIYKASNWMQVQRKNGGNWLNRPGRKCGVGKHAKIKWEYNPFVRSDTHPCPSVLDCRLSIGDFMATVKNL